MASSTFVFENLLCVTTDKFRCRVWREAMSYPSLSDNQLKGQIERRMMAGDGDSLMDFILDFVAHEGVNSVEVINVATGDGICVHKDWP